MTVELARRLIESGVPLADVEEALLMVVERGVPLSEALAEHDAGLLVVLEQELARSELPSVLTVRPIPELCARLPVGMCQRLLAVPVHVDPRNGRVDVAAVEPLDPHIAQEFGFHLKAPIRVLVAPRESVHSALARLQLGESVSLKPAEAPAASALGSELPIPLLKADPTIRSDAPIPLVRRSMLPPEGMVAAARASLTSNAPATSEEERMSWRSRPPPTDLLPRSAELEASPRPAAPSPPTPSVNEQLDEATAPEQVLALLKDGLRPALSIVFAIKNASFDARVASAEIEARVPARQISLLSHQPSVLETALKAGFYLGPIPNTPNHRELRDALPPDAAEEVYVTVVTVAERPSLLWLVAGFERSLDLTRRADETALLAGRALARILRSRKRGS